MGVIRSEIVVVNMSVSFSGFKGRGNVLFKFVPNSVPFRWWVISHSLRSKYENLCLYDCLIEEDMENAYPFLHWYKEKQ